MNRRRYVHVGWLDMKIKRSWKNVLPSRFGMMTPEASISMQSGEEVNIGLVKDGGVK